MKQVCYYLLFEDEKVSDNSHRAGYSRVRFQIQAVWLQSSTDRRK
jgi:hypothetical protein